MQPPAADKWNVVRSAVHVVLVGCLVLSTLGPSINGNHVVTAATTTTTPTTTIRVAGETTAAESNVQSTPAAHAIPALLPDDLGFGLAIDPIVNFRGLLSDNKPLTRRSLRQPDDNYRGYVRQRWRTIMGRDPRERRSRLDATAPKRVHKRAAPQDAADPVVDTDRADLSSGALNLSCHRVHRFRNTFDTNVSAVDLSCNGLQDGNMAELSFGHLPAVRHLSLAGNALTDIDRVDLRPVAAGLRTLDLAANLVRHLNASSFGQLPRLERLSLAHNQIAAIGAGTFGGMQSLQVLDLSHNRLDAGAVPALQAIQGLVAMSVAFNPRLGEALPEFVATWSLKELDASGTGLCRVPSALAQSVHALNVSYNHFEIIRRGDMDSYPLLKYLDMSHNSIADIEDDALGRLEILITLQLQHNLIAAVPTNLPASLVHLLLHDNRITDIVAANFAQLDSLQTLDLSGNRLMYVPALPLPRLVSLNLRSSGVQGLSQAVVRMSPNLKDLLLEGNPIKCTALMSIAEWTTICRSETPSPEVLDGRTQPPPQFESLLTPQPTQPSCCGRILEREQMAPTEQSAAVCKRDAVNEVKLSKKSRKLKMADIWHDLWINATSSPTGHKNPAPAINSASESASIRHSESATVAAAIVASVPARPSPSSATKVPPTHGGQSTPTVRRRNGKSLTMAAAQSADVRQAKKTKRISPSTTTPATTMSNDKKAMLSHGDGEKKATKPSQDKASSATSSALSASSAAIAGKLQINSNSLSTTGIENNSSNVLPAATTTPALTTTPDSRTTSTTTTITPMPKSPPVKADESRTSFDMASLSLATATTMTTTPGTVTTQKDVDVPARLTTPTPQSATQPATTSTTTGEPSASATSSSSSPGITDDGTNATEFVRNQWVANPVAATDRHSLPNNEQAATPITSFHTVIVAQPSAFPPTVNPARHPKRRADVSPSVDQSHFASASASSSASNIYVAEQSLVAKIDFTQAANGGGPMLVVGVGDQLEPLSAPAGKVDATTATADVVVHGHTTTTAPPAAAAALHEQWTDLQPAAAAAASAATAAPESEVGRHPGMFIVLGITIGLVVSVLAVQMWRCAQKSQLRRARRLRGLSAEGAAEAGAVGGRRLAGYDEADDGDQYAPSHRDMLPMELLGAAGSTIQYSEAPIELW